MELKEELDLITKKNLQEEKNNKNNFEDKNVAVYEKTKAELSAKDVNIYELCKIEDFDMICSRWRF